jgi:2-methylisocitrate lyase-like PEP mutase family enzyme
MNQHEKGERFRAMHEGDPFVVPNPWDVGSARVLEGLGFPALTSTSSGFAFTLGRKDGDASLDELVAHVAAVADATDVPLAVDLEHGHGPAAADAAGAIERVAEAGAVGGSIEDWDPVNRVLYPIDEAAERVAAASEAARALGFPFMLAGRAENHLRSDGDLNETVAPLQANEAAGADVLYAPGLRTTDEIRAVCEAVGKPVNVLARPDLRRDEIFAAGAQRISVGGALTWVATAALVEAATRIRDGGDFSGLGAGPPRDWLL